MLLGAALAMGPAGAQGLERPAAWSGWLQFGWSQYSESRAGGLAYDWPGSRPWAGGSVGLSIEASYAWWTPRGARLPGDPDHFQRIGVTPILRWQPDAGRWFAEVGVGAHLIGPVYRVGPKRFGSAFNFGDHVGIGWHPDAARRQAWTLRLQHFSNAGLKEPNPGENFLQLRWGLRF